MSIPMPVKPSGVFYGNRSANVQIDVFVDIQCPHSKLAWPNIRNLMKHYDKGQIGVNTHLITLSNHRQSWDISKAIFALAKEDDAKFLQCMDYFYERQESFLNKPFYHKTHADLMAFIAEHAKVIEPATDTDALLQEIDGWDIYEKARTPNRLAAIRGAWGTPTFFINHARAVNIKHDTTVEQWAEVIDPMLA